VDYSRFERRFVLPGFIHLTGWALESGRGDSPQENGIPNLYGDNWNIRFGNEFGTGKYHT
jgi:hypothetical protein